MEPKKILLILTGGTICSFATDKGEQTSNTKKAFTLIEENFRKSESRYSSEKYVEFFPEFPMDTLSENMTVAHWNVLINNLRSYDFSKYDGVIILHGTDTLAYTASLLSLILSGLSIPVILVSSQLAPYKHEANGNANFKTAVELIVNNIKPNVYVVYRNEDTNGYTKMETMYVHYGAHLMQCANHSNNFYSKDMVPISMDHAVFEGRRSLGNDPIYMNEKFDILSSKVLKIQPYVGLDYSLFSLKGVNAVVHGTYHSSTVATNPELDSFDCSKYSTMNMAELCKKQTPPIPLFLEPFVKTTYVTTGEAIRNGLLPIKNLTSEMAYVKTLVGCALGFRGEALYDYINTNINNEFLD